MKAHSFASVALVTLLILGGCMTTFDASGDNPVNQLALLNRSTSEPVTIYRNGALVYDVRNDGGADQIKLPAGAYEIRYDYFVLRPVRGEPIVSKKEGYARLILVAGHTYTAHAHECELYLTCGSRPPGTAPGCSSPHFTRCGAIYLWIEDDTLNQVVTGEAWSPVAPRSTDLKP
jgi:hypothetical protein